MESLENRLVLGGRFLVLVKLSKWEISCGDASIALVVEVLILNRETRTAPSAIKHLLHDVSVWELERVSVLVCHSHRDILIFFYFDIENLLTRNSVSQLGFSVCLSSRPLSNGDSSCTGSGWCWIDARNIDSEIVVHLCWAELRSS